MLPEPLAWRQATQTRQRTEEATVGYVHIASPLLTAVGEGIEG